jgi:hypothetical protein
MILREGLSESRALEKVIASTQGNRTWSTRFTILRGSVRLTLAFMFGVLCAVVIVYSGYQLLLTLPWGP